MLFPNKVLSGVVRFVAFYSYFRSISLIIDLIESVGNEL